MASTAKAGQVVGKIRQMCETLIDLRAEITIVTEAYTKNGGSTFIAPFFLDDQGQPRADIDVTEAQILTAVSAQIAILTALNTFIDPLVQAE